MAHGLKNCVRSDRGGGIEGLPLELMIIIIVATMGTAILVGWMGSVDVPKYLGDVIVEPGQLEIGGDGAIGGELRITVTDQDGNGIDGATVVVTGLSVKGDGGSAVTAVTGNDGTASFGGMHARLTSALGYLTVTASMPDYGEKSVKVPVVRA